MTPLATSSFTTVARYSLSSWFSRCKFLDTLFLRAVQILGAGGVRLHLADGILEILNVELLADISQKHHSSPTHILPFSIFSSSRGNETQS